MIGHQEKDNWEVDKWWVDCFKEHEGLLLGHFCFRLVSRWASVALTFVRGFHFLTEGEGFIGRRACCGHVCVVVGLVSLRCCRLSHVCRGSLAE